MTYWNQWDDIDEMHGKETYHDEEDNNFLIDRDQPQDEEQLDDF